MMLHRSRSRSKDRVNGTPGPSFMTSQQKGQTSRSFGAPPPSVEDAAPVPASSSAFASAATVRVSRLTQDRFTAQYLKDLRSNPVQRPTGARPPPSHFGSVRGRNILTKPAPVVEDSSSDKSPTKSPTDSSSRSSNELEAPANANEQPLRTTSALSIRDRDELPNRSASALSMRGRPIAQPPRDTSRKVSGSTMNSTRSTSSIEYRERAQRATEREEAHKLRMAMEGLDLEKEQKVFDDAKEEAVELVWKHQNADAPIDVSGAPYKYPGLGRKDAHGRSQSLGGEELPLRRTSSKTKHRHSYANGGVETGSSDSEGKVQAPGVSGDIMPPAAGPASKESQNGVGSQTTARARVPSAEDLSRSMKDRRRSSGSKRTPSGSLFQNPNDKIFEEPEEISTPEKMAPAKAAVPAPVPLAVRRNPFARVKFAVENLQRSNTDPTISTTKFDRYEIHKNPPTQSRNAAYTSNAPTPPRSSDGSEEDVKIKDGKEIRSEELVAATSLRLKDRSPRLPTPSMVSDTPGRPIVSFQKDYKPKEVEPKQMPNEPISKRRPSVEPVAPLRTYTPPKAVSAPVIPTVQSARTDAANSSSWLPPIKTYERYDPTRDKRSIVIPAPGSAVPIPTICAPAGPEIPKVIIPNESKPPTKGSRAPATRAVPVFSAPPPPLISMQSAPVVPTNNQPTPAYRQPPSKQSLKDRAKAFTTPRPSQPTPPSSSRPLPTPRSHAPTSTRNFPAQPSQPISKPHWTPTVNRSSALCSHCALPISGRIVSAAGSRFHPACFTCHHCAELLECVAFYPEPDTVRAERLERISARLKGHDHPSWPAPDLDGDDSKRFYCHLDYHEFFSPRCKSCKTPIEGEVVVACGAEWHVGHFFCAQCGEAFDENRPFVEKDGYAWCVGCERSRFATKCAGCGGKVVDEVVLRAGGREWHGGCFVCVECKSPFDDGRYFTREGNTDPVCVRCEERRLKA